MTAATLARLCRGTCGAIAKRYVNCRDDLTYRSQMRIAHDRCNSWRTERRVLRTGGAQATRLNEPRAELESRISRPGLCWESSVDERPTAQPLRIGGEDTVPCVRDVNAANLPRLAEMDIHVQRMLPIGRVFIRVRQLHVLLATIRCQ